MTRAGIVASKPGGYQTRTLTAAFARLGAECRFFSMADLPGRLGMPEEKRALLSCGAVALRGVPGGSLEQVIFRMDALYALERAGVPCVNSPKTLEKTVDKFFTSALLAESGLPVPETVVTESPEEAEEAFLRLGGDVVYKPIFGSCGNGMLRLTARAEARAAFYGLAARGAVLYVQRFVPCGNADIRAFVLDGRVLAAMRRSGGESWRANVTLGGRAEPYTLGSEETALAVRAASAVHAEVAGVDLLRADSGRLYVTEVNGCPGWEGLSTVCEADIPLELARFILAKAKARGRG